MKNDLEHIARRVVAWPSPQFDTVRRVPAGIEFGEFRITGFRDGWIHRKHWEQARRALS